MGYVDRTLAFREQIKELERVYPPERKTRKGKSRQGVNKEEDAVKDGFMEEAYAILGHINTLANLLSGIRKAYLNVDSNASKFWAEASRLDLESTSSWAKARSLTNEERDQIDLQSRVIIMQCKERVSQLERLETSRAQKANNLPKTLLKFLPSLISQTNAPSFAELIAAHRSNITWYLTRRLADVSQTQHEMQAERVKRQLDRARTLGSSVSGGASFAEPPSVDNLSMSASSSSFNNSRYIPPPVTSSLPLESDDDEDGDADIELTASQIQQFEEENANILREVENVLQSVQKAEARLLEISDLQTELVVQLARQTEIVDTLYDEAMTSQSEVERGNVQLRQARERARSSRKWILLFIIMATLALLFLHWYD